MGASLGPKPNMKLMRNNTMGANGQPGTGFGNVSNGQPFMNAPPIRGPKKFN